MCYKDRYGAYSRAEEEGLGRSADQSCRQTLDPAIQMVAGGGKRREREGYIASLLECGVPDNPGAQEPGKNVV